MKNREIDVYLTLRIGTESGTKSIIVQRASTWKPTEIAEREAVLHFKVEVDESIFDPAIETGAVLKVQKREDDFDVKVVVDGLHKIKDELT